VHRSAWGIEHIVVLMLENRDPGEGFAATNAPLFGTETSAAGATPTNQGFVTTFHPGYFLPTVAGGLIASAGAAETGQHRLAEIMFGLGIGCWLVLGSIILARLLFWPLPPAPLLPTLAIEVVLPAIASLAYFALHGDRIDTVTALYFGPAAVAAYRAWGRPQSHRWQQVVHRRNGVVDRLGIFQLAGDPDYG
jgi:Voltage-dependent anion channel